MDGRSIKLLIIAMVFGIPYPKGYISEVSDMTIKFVMLNTL